MKNFDWYGEILEPLFAVLFLTFPVNLILGIIVLGTGVYFTM